MAETTASAAPERSADFVAFYRPYVFEGKTYEGIDLAPVRDLTGRDLMDIDAYFRRKGRVLQALASRTGLDFFLSLPVPMLMDVGADIVEALEERGKQ